MNTAINSPETNNNTAALESSQKRTMSEMNTASQSCAAVHNKPSSASASLSRKKAKLTIDQKSTPTPTPNSIHGSNTTTASTTTTNTKNDHLFLPLNSTIEDATAADTFQPLTLSEIKTKIHSLFARVPLVPKPDGINHQNMSQVKTWATKMQTVIEEFNLLLACISPATYKWGTDRSGAADQNLILLKDELCASQDQISSSVTPRLTNVLAPTVDLVIERTVIKRYPSMTNGTTMKEEEEEENGHDGSGVVEERSNVFVQKEVDPDFSLLCSKILSRNADMLRLVVLTQFRKVESCIEDYIKQTEKDSNGQNSLAY